MASDGEASLSEQQITNEEDEEMSESTEKVEDISKTEDEEDSKPKTKVIDDGGDPTNCTLFVSNLPNKATFKDLESVFSEVGPIKRCFVIGASTDKKKKGLGYVTFSLREDAIKAIETVNTIKGSKVFVKFANKRGANVVEEEDDPEPPPSPKKAQKESAVNKSARIIIRNVKFEAKEDEIRKAFTTFGDIEEISYPTRKGGRAKGFCFLQYTKIIDAKNAIEQMNGRDFLGRTLVVDWSVAKDKYDKTKKKETDEKDVEAEKVETGVQDGEHGDDEGNERSERTSDVQEGRTLFLRNVPFDTTEQDLYEAFCPFGQVNYAVICIDTITEHPKGTAFVQYVLKEDADICLAKASNKSQDGGIFVDGRKLDVTIAVTREEIEKKKDEAEQKKDKKDGRNLHLAREGQIRPGTKAAEGVSSSDMGKRLELESWKAKMLKNLNMFISDKRLCVRNIPVKMKNKRLREIFEGAAGPGAKITELSIMRDLNKGPNKDDAPAKGFGFVAFSTHEHALAALRDVNNNPKYFSKEQRPIVEFSLESRTAVKAKEERLQKSKDNLQKNNAGRAANNNNAGRAANNNNAGRAANNNNAGRAANNNNAGRAANNNNADNRRPRRKRPASEGRNDPAKRMRIQQQPNLQTNRNQGRNVRPDQRGNRGVNRGGSRVGNRNANQGGQIQPNRVLDQIRDFMGASGILGATRPFPSHYGPKVRQVDRNQQRFNMQQNRGPSFQPFNIWQ